MSKKRQLLGVILKPEEPEPMFRFGYVHTKQRPTNVPDKRYCRRIQFTSDMIADEIIINIVVRFVYWLDILN